MIFIHSNPIPKPNLRAFRVKIQRKVQEVIRRANNCNIKAIKISEEKRKANISLTSDEVHQFMTHVRLQAVAMGSAVRLMSRTFSESLTQAKEAISRFSVLYNAEHQALKEKYQKQIRIKDSQLSSLKNELSLVKRANEISKDKLNKLKQKIKQSASPKKLPKPKVDVKPVLQSVGVLAHLVSTQAGQLQERTLRHSKEAELGVLQGQLTRANEKNERLESQIGGLRKMLKKTEELSSEESLKAKQTAKDLETQLLEQKRLVQRKSAQILKLHESNLDLGKKAERLDLLKETIKDIFGLISQKVEPILAEKSVSSELSELDEIAQEFFKVPIHKICSTKVYGGFLKKQARKLDNAMINSIEQEDILKVFEALMAELEKPHLDKK